MSRVIGIVAGNNHAVVLKNDGTVWTLGSNSNGKLGNNLPGTDSNVPVQVSTATGLSSVTSIAADNNHTVAPKNDGTA